MAQDEKTGVSGGGSDAKDRCLFTAVPAHSEHCLASTQHSIDSGSVQGISGTRRWKVGNNVVSFREMRSDPKGLLSGGLGFG